jgi:hypothetical protein
METPFEYGSKKLRLYEIVIEPALQARVNMSPNKVTDYEKAYANQVALPPILVSLQLTDDGDARYKLLDGWHRYQAIENIHGLSRRIKVQTIKVPNDASIHYLRYLGGRENLTNGLSMSSKDKRALFKAYVSGGFNRDSRKYKSYREIAIDLQLVTHQTLHNWMKADFPSVARRMSKGCEEESQSSADGTGRVLTAMPDLSSREVDIVFSDLLVKAKLSDTESRVLITDKVEALLTNLKAIPPHIIKPIFEDDEDIF